jgi:hypothetical protein
MARTYFSCPLDGPLLWEALRYTELNTVRAQLVAEGAGLGMVERRCPLCNGPVGYFFNTQLWQNHWTNARWPLLGCAS